MELPHLDRVLNLAHMFTFSIFISVTNDVILQRYAMYSPIAWCL
jgi:hypothetical protein